jgi:hypothetical protein
MRSADEIRFDTIFTLTITRHSVGRRPEIRRNPSTDIERHETADEVRREPSIQYFENSTDVQALVCFMYAKLFVA